MATFLELRVMMRQRLKLPDTSDTCPVPGLVETKSIINQTRNKMWRDIAASFTGRLDQQTTMTYTADSESVALAAALQKRAFTLVQAVSPGSSSTTNRYDLRPKAIHELDDFGDKGIPTAYAIDWGSNLIRVRPIPTVDTTLYVRYVPALTALSADGDLPSEWPPEFQDVIADGAAAQWLGENGDPEAAVSQSKFDDGMLALRRYLDSVFPDTHIHSRTTRR